MLRRDIQFLRGIAVLVVVLYHSNIGLLNQGYLGVDVFFVLSGFLITTIILKGLDNGSFSFSEFYLRRAKRLLPALYSTLVVTSLLAVIFLTDLQWQEYLEQLAGALTFTANMVLPSQVGYFANASEGKPLLHTWSLSLEEQYYFLLPVALFLIPKRFRLLAILVFATISILWCFIWVYGQNQIAPFLWRIAYTTTSDWAFYFLFTRAWELLAGSICAWIMLYKTDVYIPKTFKYLALCLIGLMCTVNINNEHPSIESLIVVLSTMVILIGNHYWLHANTITQVVERIGDWSYSIYLVHWPLFSFAYLSYVGDVPLLTKFALVLLSFYLGYLQFKFVETPFREGRLKNVFLNWKKTVSITLLMLLTPIVGLHLTADTDNEFSEIRRSNQGIGSQCNGGSFSAIGELNTDCVLGIKPKVAVWGDSYAMHLVPGLSIKNEGLTQLTKSVCGPTLGLAPIQGKHDSLWGKTCLDFNLNAFNYIKENPSITHVVLSSTLETYVNFSDGEYLTSSGVIKAEPQVLLDSLRSTILEIKKLGIIPIFISPPPKSGFNVGECLERQFSTAVLLRDNCEIDYEAYKQNQKSVHGVLDAIENIASVVWIEDYLCDSNVCNVYQEGVFLYKDAGHLTVDGSKHLFKDLDVSTFTNVDKKLSDNL